MKYLLIFIFSLLTVIVHAQNDEFHLDEIYKLEAGGTISLRSSDANVHITGSNRKDVHVKIDRYVETSGFSWGDQSFDVKVREEGGNLFISEEQEGNLTIMGSTREKYEIRIEAPSNTSLRINGDDGDYEIKKINGEISLSVDDGDVRLSDCRGKAFNFRIDDGDLAMDKGAGRIKIDADDADITIKNGAFSFIDANVDDADIRIESTLDDNGEYSFNGDDSDFILVVLGGGGEFNIRHDDSHIEAGDKFKIVDKGENRTVIRLAKGDARINFRTDDASIKLSTL